MSQRTRILYAIAVGFDVISVIAGLAMSNRALTTFGLVAFVALVVPTAVVYMFARRRDPEATPPKVSLRQASWFYAMLAVVSMVCAVWFGALAVERGDAVWGVIATGLVLLTPMCARVAYRTARAARSANPEHGCLDRRPRKPARRRQ